MKPVSLLVLSGVAMAQIPLPPNFITVAGLLPTKTLTNCPLATETPVTPPTEKMEKCGAGTPPKELVTKISQLKNSTAKTDQIPPVIQIPTYINVISTNASQFRYNDTFYLNQLAVLNDSYNTTNFQFDLAGFRRIVNDTFAVGKTEAIQNLMKRKYRNGTYNALNLYYLSDWQPIEFNGKPLPPDNYMYGSCSFPQLITSRDTVKLDGCILQQDSLPGNKVKLDASFGFTTVHEVGHWFGLLHPWGTPDTTPGQCVAQNGIFDLPLMYGPLYNCKNNIKSCAVQAIPGVDPIHNYMGYSDDCCLYEFTLGQVASMLVMFNEFRLAR
jgi:hypothetical protein